MKRLLFFSIFFLITSHSLLAQIGANYNKKGDQALSHSDFLDARIWYSEGVENCDKYSIHQLTLLWNDQTSMRGSMHVLMSKCRECLEKQVLSGDTDAMLKLSEFYKKGIGTETDSIMAVFWEKKALGMYIGEQNGGNGNTIIDTIRIVEKTTIPHLKKEPFYSDFEYFLAYSPSYYMPAGLTFGFLNDGKLGAYLTCRMNLNFISSDRESIDGIIPDLNQNSYAKSEEATEKWNHYMLTAGVICPIIKNTFISLGIGYIKRDAFLKIPIGVKATEVETPIWFHDSGFSYQGVGLELGGIFRHKHYFFSGGANTVAFKDIDAYLGLGYIF